MKTLDIKIDTGTNVFTNFLNEEYRTAPSRRIGKELSVVNGDVALLALHVQERDLTGVLGDLDLTGALAIRVSLIQNRETGSTILSFQDVYNQGDLPTNEDLAEGKVTFRLDHPPVTLDPILVAPKEFEEFFYEITWLSPSDLPQTLAQIPVRIYAQGDIGAAGSPPPSTPVYMTSATALSTFVLLQNYLTPQTIAVGDSPFSPTSQPGIKVLEVDTSGGDVTINLPEVSAADVEYILWIINLGANRVFIVPDASGTADTINGFLGTQTINSQYGEALLIASPANDNWIIPDPLIP
jgi:hypothetical protein